MAKQYKKYKNKVSKLTNMPEFMVDYYYNSLTFNELAAKYKASVSTINRVITSDEFKDKLNDFKAEQEEVIKKKHEIMTNSLTDTFVLLCKKFHEKVLDDTITPQEVKNFITLSKQVSHLYAEKRENKTHITGDIEYVIPPELQNLIDESNI